MAYDDRTDAGRLYAKDVRLDPSVNGEDNVQDALGAGGFTTLSSGLTDAAVATTPTALTGDGMSHNVDCIVSVPPVWMDNAGNITEVGLYSLTCVVTATAGPTTPAQVIALSNTAGTYALVSCDDLGAAGRTSMSLVVAVAAADLPVVVRFAVTMPTDVTEAVTVEPSVSRLAS